MVIIIIIIFAILVLYLVVNHRVTEMMNYLDNADEIKISGDFRFLKDFADRNVKIFILQSTLLFSSLAIATGVYFKIHLDGK